MGVNILSIFFPKESYKFLFLVQSRKIIPEISQYRLSVMKFYRKTAKLSKNGQNESNHTFFTNDLTNNTYEILWNIHENFDLNVFFWKMLCFEKQASKTCLIFAQLTLLKSLLYF